MLSNPQTQTVDSDKLRASDVSQSIMGGGVLDTAEHNSSYHGIQKAEKKRQEKGQGWGTPKDRF